MTDLDRAQILDQAAAELRSGHTLISDPDVMRASTGNVALLPHLLRLWQALAWLSRGQVPDGPGEDLSAWLSPAHLQQIPPTLRDELHASLRSAFAYAEAPALWSDRHAELSAGLASPRLLAQQLRSLGALLRAIDLEARGHSLRWQRARVWTGRVTIGTALAVGFTLAILRPWQAEDVGPWRAAYYPTRELEGTPEIRREVDVAFDWGVEPPTDAIPSDGYSARYDTCLVLDKTTKVAFMLVSDDGARLFIDGEPQIDRWEKRAGAIGGKKLKLKRGAHHLRVEYNERRGNAMLHLTASFKPKDPPAPIPAHMLQFPGLEIPEEGDPCEHVK
jgi:hypothetical protein